MGEYLAIVKFEFYKPIFPEYQNIRSAYEFENIKEKSRKMKIAFMTTDGSYEILERMVFEKIRNAYEQMKKDSDKSYKEVRDYIKKNNLPELGNVYLKKEDVSRNSDGWRLTIQEIYKKIPTGEYARIFDNDIFGL